MYAAKGMYGSGLHADECELGDWGADIDADQAICGPEMQEQQQPPDDVDDGSPMAIEEPDNGIGDEAMVMEYQQRDLILFATDSTMQIVECTSLAECIFGMPARSMLGLYPQPHTARETASKLLASAIALEKTDEIDGTVCDVDVGWRGDRRVSLSARLEKATVHHHPGPFTATRADEAHVIRYYVGAKHHRNHNDQECVDLSTMPWLDATSRHRAVSTDRDTNVLEAASRHPNGVPSQASERHAKAVLGNATAPDTLPSRMQAIAEGVFARLTLEGRVAHWGDAAVYVSGRRAVTPNDADPTHSIDLAQLLKSNGKQESSSAMLSLAQFAHSNMQRVCANPPEPAIPFTLRIDGHHPTSIDVVPVIQMVDDPIRTPQIELRIADVRAFVSRELARRGMEERACAVLRGCGLADAPSDDEGELAPEGEPAPAPDGERAPEDDAEAMEAAEAPSRGRGKRRHLREHPNAKATKQALISAFLRADPAMVAARRRGDDTGAVVHFSLACKPGCQAGDTCRCTTHMPKLGSTITVEHRVGKEEVELTAYVFEPQPGGPVLVAAIGCGGEKTRSTVAYIKLLLEDAARRNVTMRVLCISCKRNHAGDLANGLTDHFGDEKVVSYLSKKDGSRGCAKRLQNATIAICSPQCIKALRDNEAFKRAFADANAEILAVYDEARTTTGMIQKTEAAGGDCFPRKDESLDMLQSISRRARILMLDADADIDGNVANLARRIAPGRSIHIVSAKAPALAGIQARFAFKYPQADEGTDERNGAQQLTKAEQLLGDEPANPGRHAHLRALRAAAAFAVERVQNHIAALDDARRAEREAPAAIAEAEGEANEAAARRERLRGAASKAAASAEQLEREATEAEELAEAFVAVTERSPEGEVEKAREAREAAEAGVTQHDRLQAAAATAVEKADVAAAKAEAARDAAPRARERLLALEGVDPCPERVFIHCATVTERNWIVTFLKECGLWNKTHCRRYCASRVDGGSSASDDLADLLNTKVAWLMVAIVVVSPVVTVALNIDVAFGAVFCHTSMMGACFRDQAQGLVRVWRFPDVFPRDDGWLLSAMGARTIFVLVDATPPDRTRDETAREQQQKIADDELAILRVRNTVATQQYAPQVAADERRVERSRKRGYEASQYVRPMHDVTLEMIAVSASETLMRTRHHFDAFLHVCSQPTRDWALRSILEDADRIPEPPDVTLAPDPEPTPNEGEDDAQEDDFDHQLALMIEKGDETLSKPAASQLEWVVHAYRAFFVVQTGHLTATQFEDSFFNEKNPHGPGDVVEGGLDRLRLRGEPVRNSHVKVALQEMHHAHRPLGHLIDPKMKAAPTTTAAPATADAAAPPDAQPQPPKKRRRRATRVIESDDDADDGAADGAAPAAASATARRDASEDAKESTADGGPPPDNLYPLDGFVWKIGADTLLKKHRAAISNRACLMACEHTFLSKYVRPSAEFAQTNILPTLTKLDACLQCIGLRTVDFLPVDEAETTACTRGLGAQGFRVDPRDYPAGALLPYDVHARTIQHTVWDPAKRERVPAFVWHKPTASISGRFQQFADAYEWNRPLKTGKLAADAPVEYLDFHEKLRSLASEDFAIETPKDPSKRSTTVKLLTQIMQRFLGISIQPIFRQRVWRVDPAQRRKDNILVGIHVWYHCSTAVGMWLIQTRHTSEGAEDPLPAVWQSRRPVHIPSRPVDSDVVLTDDEHEAIAAATRPDTVLQGTACVVDAAAVASAIDALRQPPYALHLRPEIAAGAAKKPKRGDWRDKVATRLLCPPTRFGEDKATAARRVAVDYLVLRTAQQLREVHDAWWIETTTREETRLGVVRYKAIGHGLGEASLTTCSPWTRELLLGPAYARLDVLRLRPDATQWDTTAASTFHLDALLERHGDVLPNLARVRKTPPYALDKRMLANLAEVATGHAVVQSYARSRLQADVTRCSEDAVVKLVEAAVAETDRLRDVVVTHAHGYAPPYDTRADTFREKMRRCDGQGDAKDRDRVAAERAWYALTLTRLSDAALRFATAVEGVLEVAAVVLNDRLRADQPAISLYVRPRRRASDDDEDDDDGADAFATRRRVEERLRELPDGAAALTEGRVQCVPLDSAEARRQLLADADALVKLYKDHKGPIDRSAALVRAEAADEVAAAAEEAAAAAVVARIAGEDADDTGADDDTCADEDADEVASMAVDGEGA